ncbi:hypothetical protein BH10BDE1_BH10BDE1_03020 [soil metagenome]
MTSIDFRFSFLLGPLLSFLIFTACAKPQSATPVGNGGLEKAGSGSCAAQFAQSKSCVGFSWEKLPTETEFGSFIFTFTNEAGLLADLANPKIVLWMPSMGHGSSPVTIERISTGLYRATKVFFTMKGEWEIRFQTLGDQAIRAITL